MWVASLVFGTSSNASQHGISSSLCVSLFLLLEFAHLDFELTMKDRQRARKYLKHELHPDQKRKKKKKKTCSDKFCQMFLFFVFVFKLQANKNCSSKLANFQAQKFDKIALTPNKMTIIIIFLLIYHH